MPRQQLSTVGGSGSSGTGLPTNWKSVTTAGTDAVGDAVEMNGSGGAFDRTLPAGSTAGGLVTYMRTDSSANTLRVAAPAGGNINGDAFLTLAAATANLFTGAVLESKGSDVWRIVAVTAPGGTNGTNGNTVLTTSGAPASGTGANGDYAYDPTAKIMYGPKASGAWPSGVSLRGTDGTNGAIAQLQDEGSNLTVRPTINFVGSGVTATDDAANTRTLVTIPGGGATVPIFSSDFTATTIVNTVSTTAVFTLNLPTTVTAGDVIRVVAFGDALNSSGASVTRAFSLTLGATTIGPGNTVSATTGAQRTPWWFALDIAVIATNSEVVGGTLIETISSNPNVGGLLSGGTYVLSGSFAEDLTAGKTIALKIAMGTASASADFRKLGAYCQIVKGS